VWLGIGLVAVVAILVVANVRSARRRGTDVDVEAAARRALVAEVSGSGRVEARRSVDVVSSVVGKVLEVAAEEGDRVERGQVILRIDPAERKALLEQAKAARASAAAREELARAELRQTELELVRVQGLSEQGLATAQGLEQAETARDVARARLTAAAQEVVDARARVDHAQTELDRTVIRAEIPGVVVRMAVEEGENVLAGDLYNIGSAIVTVADLSRMEAQILVDETEVVHVRPGQRARVEVDAFPGVEIAGAVVEVGNSAYEAGSLGSQEAKDFRVRILLEEPPSSLRPGLSARADIVTDTREEALSVPIEALVLRDPAEQAAKLSRKSRRRAAAEAAGADTTSGSGEDREKEGVFVVRDGVAVFVPIETGIAGERHFEVLAGLEAGAPVIRGPFDALRRLASGDRVRERQEKERDGGSGKRAGSGAEGDEARP
jgi:HlyD family secretion protein